MEGGCNGDSHTDYGRLSSLQGSHGPSGAAGSVGPIGIPVSVDSSVDVLLFVSCRLLRCWSMRGRDVGGEDECLPCTMLFRLM